MWTSWRFWLFVICAPIGNVALALVGVPWPMIAGAWAGFFAASNPRIFEVRK